MGEVILLVESWSRERQEGQSRLQDGGPAWQHAPSLELLTINQWSCTITEEAPTRAFSWLKEPMGVDPTVRRREIGTPAQRS